MQIYCNDNNNRLPDLRQPPYSATAGTAFGLWPWDVSTNLTTVMMDNGASRNIFYCPSYPEFNVTNTWDFNPNFRITGYVWMLPGAGMNLTSGFPEAPYWKINILGTPGNPPSDSEIVVDVVVRDQTTKSYTHLSIGGLTINQRTSHLDGSLPAGGNILFEDSHVEWRPFKVMLNDGKHFGNPLFLF
jgi:hypothetical protein